MKKGPLTQEELDALLEYIMAIISNGEGTWCTPSYAQARYKQLQRLLVGGEGIERMSKEETP